MVKGLPLAPGSVCGVDCSHVLEHISLEECRAALNNVYTCLEPGGYFRLVLPDLEHMIENYRLNQSPEAAVNFIEATGMGQSFNVRSVQNVFRGFLGCSRLLWLWDYKSLAKEVAGAGFVEIRRARFGDAADPAFTSVEDPARWDTHLGIECRKPVS